MIPVTAPADKRFLRAHVRPVRRRTTWRTAFRVARVVALAGLLLYGAGRVVSVLRTSTTLRIDRITIRGTERLSKSEVAALLDGLRGQNILGVDLERERQRLRQSPWVAEAVLRRRLPASVDVVITERHPMAIGRLGGRLFLIDDQGTVMDEYGPTYAEFDLPMIDGLAPDGKSTIDRARADLASRVIASLASRPDLARRVSQIDVSDAGDAVVLLDTDGALLRLGDRDFRERLEAYLDLAPKVREHVASIDYVDLRYGSNVFVGGSSTGGHGAVRTAGRR